MTVVNYADRRKDYMDDDWKSTTGNSGSPTEEPCAGLTTFYDDVRHPQIYEDDATAEGARPKGMPAPKEHTQAERDLRNLTHMPFRSWCKICLRAKSRGHIHRHIYERRPCLQADYGFLVDKDTKQGNTSSLLCVCDYGNGYVKRCTTQGFK